MWNRTAGQAHQDAHASLPSPTWAATVSGRRLGTSTGANVNHASHSIVSSSEMECSSAGGSNDLTMRGRPLTIEEYQFVISVHSGTTAGSVHGDTLTLRRPGVGSRTFVAGGGA
jgi:hypothetical protein